MRCHGDDDGNDDSVYGPNLRPSPLPLCPPPGSPGVLSLTSGGGQGKSFLQIPSRTGPAAHVHRHCTQPADTAASSGLEPRPGLQDMASLLCLHPPAVQLGSRLRSSELETPCLRKMVSDSWQSPVRCNRDFLFFSSKLSSGW